MHKWIVPNIDIATRLEVLVNIDLSDLIFVLSDEKYYVNRIRYSDKTVVSVYTLFHHRNST